MMIIGCDFHPSIRASTFLHDHLRPAATGAEVVLAKGQRFGLPNLRHSLSTWLVNKGKIDPKTVQGMLRHSDIRTTLHLYTHLDKRGKNEIVDLRIGTLRALK